MLLIDKHLKSSRRHWELNQLPQRRRQATQLFKCLSVTPVVCKSFKSFGRLLTAPRKVHRRVLHRGERVVGKKRNTVPIHLLRKNVHAVLASDQEMR